MEQKYIINKNGDKALPITSESAVRDSNGNPLSSKLGVINDALDNRYTKSETYSKSQLDNLITTPNQKYVTVEADDQTTAATDVLPATGEKDTIYRVGNWDGSAYDITCYSEYAWDGTAYKFLGKKSQIGEVYDISAANGNDTYTDLNDALTSNTGGVPSSLRKGGMSVKFIQTSDNKYVQYRYMLSDVSNAAFVNTDNWQGVDEELKRNSQNLITSGAVEKVVRDISLEEIAGEDDQIVITDDSDNIIVAIDDEGVDAKNLKSNGHPVADAELVDSLDKRTEFVHSQKTNTKVEECVEIADNNGIVCTKMKTEMVGNDNKEEFILEYDSGDECMKVGEDGLFVNGRKINSVPVIRKLFNYKNIVCCGDSVTEGYVSEGTSTQIYINRVVSDRSYPAQLQKMFPGLTITTKARAGDDVSAWRNHFYANTDFSEYDLIIFELGLNGYLNINDINTEGTNTYNYRVLIQDVRTQNADAVIVLVRSSHFSGTWLPVLQYIAEESNCEIIDLTDTTYLNLDSAVYHGYIYQNNEFIFDWAHFTRKGYDAKAYVIAHLIEDKLTDETIYN